jgi:ATP-binding cassette subfamily A (ABC1) protein 3
LKAAGTSFFLKKIVGLDYRLVCVKGPNCDPRKVTEALSKFIPEITVATDIGEYF